MSKPRAIAGAVFLPLTCTAKVALMAAVFLWVLVADIIPNDIETILAEWQKP